MNQAVTTSDGDMEVGMEERVLAQLGIGEKPKPEAKPAQDAPAETVETAETTDTTDEVTEAPDNVIEIEFKGGKYKVPAELKELQDGYLRQEDYTKKTQETAEMRKMVELRDQQQQAQSALQQVAQPYLERLMVLNNQITQYAQVDWNQLSNQDATEANRHWIAYQSLKDKKQGLEQEMQGVAAQHLNKLKETAERLKSENSKILSEKVKGWSAERDQKVRDFAVRNYGFSQQEVGQVFDARILRLMSDALEWQNLQSSKTAMTKQAAQAQKTLKPSATVPQTAAKAKEAELKRQLRTDKTSAAKARTIQQILERRL